MSIKLRLESLTNSVVLLGLFYFVTYTVFTLANTLESQPIAGLLESKAIFIVLLAPILFKYIFQLLSLPLYPILESLRNNNQAVNSGRKVSVLIPAWNEEIGILKTLSSVVSTNFHNLEIIVINDGSTDNTHQLVTHFIDCYEKQHQHSKHKVTFKYLKLPNGGKAVAMNQGLKIASGEFVITLDADSVMDKGMINNVLARFSDEAVAAVAGNVVIGNRKKPIEILQQLEYLHGFCFKRADSNFNSVHIIGGAAAAYRKSILIEVGGFDEAIITEDVEISTRLLARGYKTRYAANAVVFTEGPSDWKSLCSQRLRWKFGRLQTYIKHKSLFLNPKKSANPYLTMLILPVAIYVELILLLEPILLTIFYGYTILASDYWPLVFMISLTASVIWMQIICDSKFKFHSNLILLAPVAWIMFYLVDLVEFLALCGSLKRFAKNQKLEWQTWARVGILSKSVARTVNHSNIVFLENKGNTSITGINQYSRIPDPVAKIR